MLAAPVLQSGFISFPNRDLQRDNPIEPSLRSEVIFKTKKNPLVQYHYSKEVSELFSRWINNKNALKDFGFRERILKATFNLFHNTSFYQWLRFQTDKPTFSDLHKLYVLETLDYLCYGNSRKTENIQWIRLLEASEKANQVKVDLAKYFETSVSVSNSSQISSKGFSEFNTDPVRETPRLPQKLEDIVMLWTSKERGFEDLLITLNVIFGSRFQNTDVNEMTS